MIVVDDVCVCVCATRRHRSICAVLVIMYVGVSDMASARPEAVSTCLVCASNVRLCTKSHPNAGGSCHNLTVITKPSQF